MPIVSGGSGGGLPSQWTVGSDGSLTITISDAAGVLKLFRGSGAGGRIEGGVVDSGGGVEEANLAISGVGGGSSFVTVSNGSAAGTASTIDGEGHIDVFTKTGVNAFEAWDDAGNTLRYALLKAGQPMLGVNAAPADADLAANQCALWFDPTNGAAKLMVKAKQADGTVKTASVALA
jgi:hypothetical protein